MAQRSCCASGRSRTLIPRGCQVFIRGSQFARLVYRTLRYFFCHYISLFLTIIALNYFSIPQASPDHPSIACKGAPFGDREPSLGAPGAGTERRHDAGLQRREGPRSLARQLL